MSSELNESFLRSLVDFNAAEKRVLSRVSALADGPDVLRFFARYASWNGYFANGVTGLVSMIGNNRDLFREKGFPRSVSDRSNFIASFIFDAARDEYDDHINPIRDTHRCMAQASLISMQRYFKLSDEVLDEEDPHELNEVNRAVLSGYLGETRKEEGDAGRIFAGIGYHLGSELLADREFSLIDAHLRQHYPDLVTSLLRSTVDLAGGKHRCYAWVGVHSGQGGGVEADHFEFALGAARAGLKYLTNYNEQTAVAALCDGFKAFESDHARFFSIPVV